MGSFSPLIASDPITCGIRRGQWVAERDNNFRHPSADKTIEEPPDLTSENQSSPADILPLHITLMNNDKSLSTDTVEKDPGDRREKIIRK